MLVSWVLAGPPGFMLPDLSNLSVWAPVSTRSTVLAHELQVRILVPWPHEDGGYAARLGLTRIWS